MISYINGVNMKLPWPLNITYYRFNSIYNSKHIKRFPTVGAFIGFLPVYFLLFYQSNFQGKRILTVDALICFFPSVCSLMIY